MKIIPYARQSIDRIDAQSVNRALQSDWITQGPKVKEFEDALAKYCGAEYAVMVSSGTAALHIACLAIEIKPNDEVITSPITFVASANSVLYCGGRPVFADVQEETANIDPGKAGKKISRKTKAIIPVHFAGHPSDLAGIQRIAKKRNIAVIEDACHALGAEYKVNGKWLKIGSCRHSDMAVFSFHPAKHITTGEGGVITTNSKKLYEKLKALRSHGIYKNTIKTEPWYYEMRALGFNYRITDFQCVLGISQLKKINTFIQKRKGIIEKYSRAFKNNEYFELPKEKNNIQSSWHLYPIRLKNKYIKKRGKIFLELKKKGLGVQVHYIPVYWQPYYQKLGYKKGACPDAEYFYQREISIPLYPALKDVEIKYVINTLMDTFQKYA